MKFQLHPGYTFSADEAITIARLNALFSSGYGTILEGTVGTNDIANEAVTGAKLAAALDISGKTVTLPATSVTAGMLAAALDLSGKTLTLPTKFYYKTGIDPAVTAPDMAGQLGLDTDTPARWWFATGTGAGDWDAVNDECREFPTQAADPANLADNVRLYTKDSGGGQLDLYFRRAVGAAERLTGNTGTAIAAKDAPDWDSGWTETAANSRYDLTNDAAGKFSDDAKGSTTTGVTPASGTLNFTQYRLAKILVKKIGTVAPHLDFFTFGPCIPENNSYGGYIIEAGGNWGGGGFDHTLTDGNYDHTTGTLYFQTLYSGVWRANFSGIAAALCDWDEKTNYYLPTALVRIQLWQ